MTERRFEAGTGAVAVERDRAAVNTANAAGERGDAPAPAKIEQRRVTAGGMSWRLSELGSGPEILLLHGTGSSAHTWKAIAPLLASGGRLLMPDLPGHAGSGLPPGKRLTLETMAAAVAGLLAAVDARPVLAVGHSAGAAILAQMALDRSISPGAILSLNGAFLPFEGATSHVFGQLARLLAVAPLVPRLAAWRYANRRAVERLVTQVGSSLGAEQLDDYVALLRSPAHIAAALEMMANWDLAALCRRLPALTVPLELIACENDRAVPVTQAEQLVERVPDCRLHRLPGLGHLGHEEDPARVAALLRELARAANLPL